MTFWHEVDGLLLRQAAKHADEIRAAFIRTVPVNDIVNRWADTRTADETVTPLEARDWAVNNFKLPERPLKDALDHVYATGWAIGDDASVAAYANARLEYKKAAPSSQQMSAAINADWSSWTPGNRPAALLVRPPGGLKRLLDKADATVAEVNNTTLNRIGTLLADSLGSGASYDSLARALLRDDITSSVIKDAARAQMIAVTEMSRALNTSTVDNYASFGVEKVEWLAIDTGTCEICPANEAQGPIPLGEVFDSGDEAPPAHPNCRCTVLPVVDEGQVAAAEGPLVDGVDEALPMEISDAADHGIEDVVAEPAASSVADLPKLDDLFSDKYFVSRTEDFQNIYGSQDFNGFEVKVYDATSHPFKNGSEIKVSATVVAPDGKTAGKIDRTFYRDKSGITVHHDLLRLSKEYRGQGFSTAFSKFSEEYYVANGVNKIEIFAALEDGAYTWAKAGYEFDGKPFSVIRRLDDIAERLRSAATDLDGGARRLEKYYGNISAPEAQSLADRLEEAVRRLASRRPEDYLAPRDLALMDGPNIDGKSFGRWLLNDTNYEAVKVLK